MTGMGTVFRFEYTQQVRKKPSVITTVLLAIAAVIAALCPALFASSLESSGDAQTVAGGVYYADASLAGTLPFEDDHVYSSEGALRDAVTDGTESVGFVVSDPTHITTYYNNYTAGVAKDSSLVRSMLQQIYVTSRLAASGVSPEEYEALLSTPVDENRQILGRDTTTQYAMAIVYLVLVYMVVLFYGQTVAAAVAREKDSKTMELLITSTRPSNLILGKVAGLTCAALTQLSVVLAALLATFAGARPHYPQAVQDMLTTVLDTSMLGVYLINFVLALMLYMVLYAALGSLVSRVEDVSTATAPVIALVVIAYFLAFYATNGTTSALLDVGSWIPFFSVFVMPIRFSVGTASWALVLGSTAVTLAFTVALAWMSVRIYRWGTLRYGSRVGLVTAVRKAFAKE